MNDQIVSHFKIGSLLPLIMVVLSIIACRGGVAPATETSSPVPPTNTPPPLPTNTPKPTRTPQPTETPLPTPAAVGESVLAENIEITVVDAYDRERIYPGGEYLYTPNPGYLIVDMGVRIRNLNPGETVSIPWQQVYILEDNGDSWYPIWGKAKLVESDKTYDPFNIGISSDQLDGEEIISFEGDVYLRIVYIVLDSNKHILFGIGDSPQIELTLRK